MDDGHVRLRLRFAAAGSVLAAHPEKVRADEGIELAVEHRVRVSALHAGAHVLHHPVRREHVVADLRAERDIRLGGLDPVALRLLLAQLQLVEPRLERLPGHGPVLVLAALVLHRHHDARGDVGHANGRVGLVDFLAARAGGPEGVDAHVVGIEIDVDVFVDLGIDEDAGKRGVPASVGVERRDAHQPVHADFRLEPSVGMVAAGDEGGVLDPRLLAGLEIAQLHFPSFALAVSRVHAEEHQGPVLRLGSPGARVDLDDGVEMVLWTAVHPGQLEALRSLHRLGQRELRLLPGRRVVRFLGQLVKRDRIVEPLPLPLVLGDLELEAALLAAQGLGALLILPETWLHALPLDQLDARALAIDVKAPPGAHRSAGRSRPAPVEASACLPSTAKSTWRESDLSAAPRASTPPSLRIRAGAALPRPSCGPRWARRGHIPGNAGCRARAAAAARRRAASRLPSPAVAPCRSRSPRLRERQAPRAERRARPSAGPWPATGGSAIGSRDPRRARWTGLPAPSAARWREALTRRRRPLAPSRPPRRGEASPDRLACSCASG